MPSNLPLKLTQAQTEDMKHQLREIENGFIHRGLDPKTVTLELAMVCARYAVNAGILDQSRLPQEPHVQEQAAPPSSPDSGHAARRVTPAGEDHDDEG